MLASIISSKRRWSEMLAFSNDYYGFIFRATQSVELFCAYVEKYSKSLLKPLRSFAEGLKRDIDAVENAVAYDYSNGFVEGTNSRLKMIKRTMYGRCGRQLLEAKLRYMGYNNNNG